VFQRLRKKIPYTSAVHMPFKNAVMYILLYGTAECYYFQKTLDKDCTVPTICMAYNKTPYRGVNERLKRFFFQESFADHCPIPVYNILYYNYVRLTNSPERSPIPDEMAALHR